MLHSNHPNKCKIAVVTSVSKEKYLVLISKRWHLAREVREEVIAELRPEGWLEVNQAEGRAWKNTSGRGKSLCAACNVREHSECEGEAREAGGARVLLGFLSQVSGVLFIFWEQWEATKEFSADTMCALKRSLWIEWVWKIDWRNSLGTRVDQCPGSWCYWHFVLRVVVKKINSGNHCSGGF